MVVSDKRFAYRTAGRGCGRNRNRVIRRSRIGNGRGRLAGQVRRICAACSDEDTLPGKACLVAVGLFGVFVVCYVVPALLMVIGGWFGINP